MIRFIDNESLQPIFETINIMDLSVNDSKKATRSSVETGAIRSDHVIDNLIEINLSVQLTTDESANEFNDIKTYYTDKKLVTIQCKMGTYVNMLIEEMPFYENASNLYGATIDIKLIEWNEVTPEYGELKQEKVKDKKKASTQERGRVAGSDSKNTPPEKKQSLAKRVFS
jgi:hypothetical protein